MILDKMVMKNAYIFVHDIKQHAGTELAALKLAEVLSSHKVNGKIFSFADYADDKYFTMSKFQRWKRDFSLIRKVVRESKGAYLIGTTHAINILIVLASLGSEVKTILCEHLPYFSKSIIQKVTARLIYRFADAVVYLTRRDAENYKLNNVCVIPNYIESSNESYKLIDGGDSINFLIVGRLCHQKGTDLLPKIIADFDLKNLNYKLKICGIGPMLEVVEDLVAKNPRVEYLGQVERARSLMELGRADILLLPSRFEGFPFVMLESLSLGTPVVAFDCPTGPSEIMSTDTGKLVEYLDIEEFARTATEFAKKVKSNPVLYDANCKIRAKKFSKENFERQWVELLGAL